MPPFVVVSPGQTVREAIALLHEHSVSQLPVVEESDIVGSVGERGLLRPHVRDPSTMDSVIVEVMEEPFPAVSTATRCGRRSSCGR
jgi:cystathionine beta-synthase